MTSLLGAGGTSASENQLGSVERTSEALKENVMANMLVRL